MTPCPIRILQEGPREVVPMRQALGGDVPADEPSPGWASHPLSPPRGPQDCGAHRSHSRAAGPPADSAALFQAWSGLCAAEDCGSFCAEKPQITQATGPDKASVRGFLPDRPAVPAGPKGPCSRSLSPGVSPSLGAQPSCQRLSNRLADPSPLLSSV